MYQGIHLCSATVVAVVFIFIVALGYQLRHDSKRGRVLLTAIAAFQVFFEIFWRLVYITVKGDSLLCWWPVFPCNLGGILVPFFALINFRKGKQMFYLFAFVGGVLTFAYPDGIYCSDVLSFPILKSILQHTGLLMIPALEYAAGTYRPTLKDMGWVIAGCFIHLLNCEGIDRLFGFTGDYMFFRSGLPFVIPGVPQFITLSVFALILLSLLSFLCDIHGSIAFIRQLRHSLPANKHVHRL